MAQEPETSGIVNESYDIFLCTRGLPDKLTGETAALRQLCAALIGSGYKVFFAPSLPKDTPPETLAMAMAGAVKTSPVMIAAAVGDEGAQDNTARFLWRQFREAAKSDPTRRFIACGRDLSALPEEFAGAEVLDMGDLEFLVKLRDQLRAALPNVAGPETEFPAPEAPEPPEEEPEAFDDADEDAFDNAASRTAEEPSSRGRFWLLLVIAVIVFLIVRHFLKK